MKEFNSINPVTEEIIAHYPCMSDIKVDEVILQTDKAGQYWQKTSFTERTRCLQRMAALLKENVHDLASLITVEMGKPLTQSIAEIEKCAKLFEFYAEEGVNFLQPEMIETSYAKSYRYFQPLGTIFAVMPWNFPYWQVMRFAAPNLLLGNAGLLKHSPNTMGCSLAIEKLFLAAGFPENLFRSLVIDIDLVANVIHHPLVAGVTLTGSPNAGKSVAKEAGAALKKTVLELGGNDPYIILPDADLEYAAEQIVTARLGINAGQSCIAPKRIIVVDEIKNAFEKILLQKSQLYQYGDPLNPQTLMGPLARKDLQLHLHDQVQRSMAGGAVCLLGGDIPKIKGFYYPATILTGINEDSPAFTEELFGPVICLYSAKNTEEALRLANNTQYGLGAAVFTRDLEKGEQLAQNINAGMCAVNAFLASQPALPFGGIKNSGFGRELSKEGLHEFANIKTIMVKNV